MIRGTRGKQGVVLRAKKCPGDWSNSPGACVRTARRSEPMPNPTARPTTYRGVRMRSRLEASYAAALDRAVGREPARYPHGWTYEPMCFACERGQYLPDFGICVLAANGLVQIYIEVKPTIPGGPFLVTLMDRMAIIWESEPEAVLQIVELDGRQRSWLGVQTPHGPWWGSGDVILRPKAVP